MSDMIIKSAQIPSGGIIFVLLSHVPCCILSPPPPHFSFFIFHVFYLSVLLSFLSLPLLDMFLPFSYLSLYLLPIFRFISTHPVTHIYFPFLLIVSYHCLCHILSVVYFLVLQHVRYWLLLIC